MTKIAVILCGCGHLDGSEIREATLTLLELDRADADYQCFAPAGPQRHVINHVTRTEAEGETRCMLQESARIARGAVLPLSELRAEHYDGLMIPGGFGAAKNLCDIALQGKNASYIHPEFRETALAFVRTGKPVGAICIAPAVLTLALRGEYRPRVTIGEDADGLIEALGGMHERCDVTACVEDPVLHIFTTPAYMREARLKDISSGIAAVAQNVVRYAAKARTAA